MDILSLGWKKLTVLSGFGMTTIGLFAFGLHSVVGISLFLLGWLVMLPALAIYMRQGRELRYRKQLRRRKEFYGELWAYREKEYDRRDYGI